MYYGVVLPQNVYILGSWEYNFAIFTYGLISLQAFYTDSFRDLVYLVYPVNSLFMQPNQKLFTELMRFYINSYIANRKTSQLDNPH
jgi:hypothetical protein